MRLSITLLLLTIFTSFSTLAHAFSVVQLCDTQLGMGGYEHDVKTFRLAVKHINSINPDLVIVCGDLVNESTNDSFADFQEIRSTLTVPCYVAPGNHDVGNDPTAESLRRYRERIGEDYYSFEHKGYTFVITNTQLWKAPLAGESEKHDAWFEGVLKSAKAKGSPIIVAGHFPPFVEKLNEAENYFNLPLAKRKQLLRLCKEHGVVAIWAGHIHRNAITEYKGIPIVATASTSRNTSHWPMGFRVWEIASDGTLTHEYVSVIGASPPGRPPRTR